MDMATPPTQDTIQQRRKLAQALMQQGTDTSPVGHWTQAAARVAQALAGGYYGNEATKAATQREAYDLKQAEAKRNEARGYAEGAMQREVQQRAGLAQQYGFKPGTQQFQQFVLTGKMPDPNADLDRRYKEAQIQALQKKGAGNLLASDYTHGAPKGVMWNDPRDPNKGTRPVPGYEQTIPGEVAGKVAQMGDARERIKKTRAIFEKDWSAGDVGQWAAGNIPLLGDISALSGDIGIAQRDVRVGIEAALRTMTGAAAPEQEVQRYMQMYMPGIKDTPESAKQKLDGLVSFMDRAENLVMQGRGGVRPQAQTQYQPQPSQAPQAGDALQQAREAIANGADRNAVMQRLQQSGINPAGL